MDPATEEATALGVLSYNVFGTNDAIGKLGGQPFDNRFRFYRGSDDDFRLNLLVQRFTADGGALNEVEANYQTSGRLVRPLVTLHTTGDPIIPYWHEPLYQLKTWFAGSARLHANVPSFRYGHCSFGAGDVILGFALLVVKVRGHELVGAEQVLTDPAAREEFRERARALGAVSTPSCKR